MPTTISNGQPTLAITAAIVQFGQFPARQSFLFDPNAEVFADLSRADAAESDREFFTTNGFGSDPTIGEIRFFGFDYAPRNFAALDGQTITISQNNALFAILGTTFGGDGRMNFSLPDLGGRLAVGFGQGPGLSNYSLGEVRGSDNIALTAANLPVNFGGSGAAINNVQPTLALNWLITTEGNLPSTNGAPSDFATTSGFSGEGLIGTLQPFAGNFAPRGTMFAAGQLLPISGNEALFLVIGTTYGGNGQTTFALPDLRGVSPVGTGTGPGLPSVSLGERIGRETITVTGSNLPTDIGGSGQAINNYGPGLGVTYLVVTEGDFPSRNAVSFDTPAAQAGSSSAPYPILGEIIAFAGRFVPSGFAAADGSLLQISENSALFALFGTTYGGDGQTTFALPDLRGRSIINRDSGIPIGTSSGIPTFTVGLDAVPGRSQSGGEIDDTIIGANGDDQFFGNGGNDLLDGGSGNDLLDGGSGNDMLNGGPGADLLLGGTGNDIYQFPDASDTLAEGLSEGIDTVRVNISFALPDNFENLDLFGPGAVNGTGNDLDNSINGSSASNMLDGGGGNDIIRGRTGNDVIIGGEGNDSLFGDADNDTLNGGNGNDALDGGIGMDILNGGEGDDTLEGGNGNDVLNGDGGTDGLMGEDGFDTLRGGDGNDTLNGGAKLDMLFGDAGMDIIIGGADRDIVAGGADADMFVFRDGDFAPGLTPTTSDRITDFSRSEGDKVDLSAVDAVVGGGDNAFTFIGTAAFSGVAGQLRFENGGNAFTLISGDTNGDAVADFAIRLDGVIALTAGDFVL